MPFLSFVPHVKSSGMTVELDPKGDKITCPAFGLYSSPVKYSTMRHIVLDLTSLAYQPKSREGSARPTKHETFALMAKKSAYPAHSQELDGHEDDKPVVRSDRTTFLKMKMINLRCNQHLRSEKVKSESAAIRRVPTRYGEDKDHQSGEIHLPHWNRMRQELRVSDQEKSQALAKNSDRETLHNNIKKLLDVRSLKDLHQKHYHVSSAQFKKSTDRLDIPGKVYDLYQHMVKTCPFCNPTEPRPDSLRVSGLRAEEFRDLIFLDHGSTEIGDQTHWISDCFGWCYFALNSISMKEYLSSRGHLKTS